jgi:hypothetical protein
LRLAQAELPRYAQIRHGPLEYGKDVGAVFETGGRRVLQMWQAKIGDITVQKWRESRNELEEMYQVPLASLQIGVEVDERVGILVCNGHAAGHNTPSNQNPHALWQGSSQNRSVTITGSSNSCIWM